METTLKTTALGVCTALVLLYTATAGGAPAAPTAAPGLLADAGDQRRSVSPARPFFAV